MAELTAFLQALRASTADLLLGLDAEQWRDADVSTPSLCEGWTRGHVLTHLARNADGITATLSGALRGEIVARYPDGWDARNAAIEAGARRPLTELVADVRESADRQDRVLGAVGDADGWELETDEGAVAGHWVSRRWREVEIHRVDLAGSYTPDLWPPPFVAWLLPEVAATLSKRARSALRVTIGEDASLGTEHVGASWTAGDGGAVTEVRGPDWAVLAWLLGRTPQVVGSALSATPHLAPWA